MLLRLLLHMEMRKMDTVYVSGTPGFLGSHQWAYLSCPAVRVILKHSQFFLLRHTQHHL